MHYYKPKISKSQRPKETRGARARSGDGTQPYPNSGQVLFEIQIRATRNAKTKPY